MYRINDVKHLLSSDDVVYGNEYHEFTKVADIANVDEKTLDWIHVKNREPYSYILKSKAKVIIVPKSVEAQLDSDSLDKTIIVSNNPMLLFSRIARELFEDRPDLGIHSSAVIHSEAKIGKDVSVGPFCCIGKCEIGDNCVIHSHVSIYDNVIIGNNVLIKDGARIGQSGFGFVKNELDEYERFPQVGRVLIKDYVEIGANTCIDRGALSDTCIHKGVKINNLCHIAHNVVIGDQTTVTAHVNISGSTIIGTNVWIGPNATLLGQQRVSDNVLIGAGAVVVSEVPAAQVWVGNPARFLRENSV